MVSPWLSMGPGVRVAGEPHGFQTTWLPDHAVAARLPHGPAATVPQPSHTASCQPHGRRATWRVSHVAGSNAAARERRGFDCLK